MAEIGTVASAITLVQVAAQLFKFGREIIGASEEWKRYCTSLDNLGHVHEVVSEVINNLDLPANLTVKVDDNEPESLITFCNNRLDMVRKQGSELLKKFKENTTQKTIVKKILTKIRQKTSKRLYYVLTADQVQSLIQSVEHEKSCLQLALSVAILGAHGQEHRVTQDKIQELKKEMLAQFQVLATAQCEIRLILDRIPVTLSDHTEPDQNHPLSGSLRDGPLASNVDEAIFPDSRLQIDLTVACHSSLDRNTVENKDSGADELPEGTETGVEEPEDQPSLEITHAGERQDDCSMQTSGIMISSRSIIEQLRNDRNLEFRESDLQEIEDYLVNHDDTLVSEDTSVSDETSVSEEGGIMISARSVFSTRLVKELCSSELGEGYEFCVRAIAYQNGKNIFYFREPCSQQPCDHITVYLEHDFESIEDGMEFYIQEMELVSSDEQTSSSIEGDSDRDDSGADVADKIDAETFLSEAGHSDVSRSTVDSISSHEIETSRSEIAESVESVVELYVPDSCDKNCTHTYVIFGRNGMVTCATNGRFHYSFGKIVERTLPSSLPCVFCFKEAKEPTMSFANTEGMWLLYKRKYRYKCLRCGKATTIKG